LIIDDQAANDAHALKWFETFAQRLNTNLDACGYSLCPGQIMARNPSYRKTLSQWREQISIICERPNERAARWSSIMFDFDTQRGDPALTHSLREHLNTVLGDSSRLLHFMVDDDARGRAPLNWFNRLIATGQRDGEDTVDIKRNGLRMVANAARIHALGQGISNCNTGERIRGLSRAGIVSGDFERTIIDAFDELQGILLTHQLRQQSAGQIPDKQVAPKDLSDIERDALRISMRAVKRFQELLQDRFGGAQL
jgi:CBS domain-containing protein